MAKTYRPKSRARRHDLQTLLILQGWVAVEDGIAHPQYGSFFRVDGMVRAYMSFQGPDALKQVEWNELPNGAFYACFTRGIETGVINA